MENPLYPCHGITLMVSEDVETELGAQFLLIYFLLVFHNILFNTQDDYILNCPLVSFVSLLNQDMDKGDPVDVVYLNFQKAFDKIAHQRLHTKLKGYGIKGRALLQFS